MIETYLNIILFIKFQNHILKLVGIAAQEVGKKKTS